MGTTETKSENKLVNSKAGFTLNEENMSAARKIIAKYPDGRQKSAVIPLLDIAQRQNGGWLSVPAIEHIAELLDISYMKAYEVASFYSMFNLKPVGKFHIQICGTTPCWLCGSDEITKSFEDATGAKKGSTSEDGIFTITEVECLGACTNAPMVQINDDYYEKLSKENVKKIVDDLKTSGQNDLVTKNSY